MYETPRNGIKFGGHRPRCPATDPGKKVLLMKKACNYVKQIEELIVLYVVIFNCEAKLK